MSRKDQSAQNRRTILAAALRCFAAKGYHATTLEEIRRAAGLSIGSIYYHFASKEQLAHALYMEGLSAYHAALLTDLALAPDARTGIEGMVRFDLERLAETDAWSRYRFPANEPRLSPATTEAIAALQQAFVVDLASWLGPNIEAGILSRVPIAFYLALLFGPVHDFAEAWLAGRREPTLDEASMALPAAAWAALRRSDAA